MMKKALPYILSSGLLVYLIIVLTFADRKTKEVECRGIHVSISGADGNAFIDEAEVAGWLGRHYGGLEKGLMHRADKDSMERVLAEGQCFTLRDLAVSGRDLLALGIPSGPGLGRLLSLLLDQVLDGTLPNERDALLQKANTLR